MCSGQLPQTQQPMKLPEAAPARSVEAAWGQRVGVEDVLPWDTLRALGGPESINSSCTSLPKYPLLQEDFLEPSN